MRVALLVLKSGVTLLTYTDELDYEPKCHLYKPHTFSGKVKVTLTSWPVGAKDEHILIHSGELLTAVEPLDELVKAYVNKVGQPPLETKPIMLSEEEMVPNDYEPRYVEG